MGSLATNYGPMSYPGMLWPGTIDYNQLPVVQNPDGSVSTVRSLGVGLGGLEYLLPTLAPDGRPLTPQEAVDLWRVSNRHLGVFLTPEAAQQFAEQYHAQMRPY